MPLISTPVTDPDGKMNIAWYRFFQSLYARSGLNTPNFGVTRPNSFDASLHQRIYPQFYATDNHSPSAKVLVLINQETGGLIGIIGYTP